MSKFAVALRNHHSDIIFNGAFCDLLVEIGAKSNGFPPHSRTDVGPLPRLGHAHHVVDLGGADGTLPEIGSESALNQAPAWP